MQQPLALVQGPVNKQQLLVLLLGDETTTAPPAGCLGD